MTIIIIIIIIITLLCYIKNHSGVQTRHCNFKTDNDTK